MGFLPLDYALRNLLRRPLRTVLTGCACALVAAAFAAASAFVESLQQGFTGAGRDDVAILLSSVSQRDVIRSTVALAVPELAVADVPGISRQGSLPLASAEIHMGTNLRLGDQPGTPPEAVYPAFVRGVTPRAFLVHDALTLLEGSPPRTGDVIVGRLVAKKLGVDPAFLAIGRKLRFEGGTFTISGIFAAPGTTIESEIWTPLQELQGLVKRDDASVVFVKVDHPSVIDDLQVFATKRKDLELVCIASSVYYRELGAYFDPIRKLAWVMALLIGAAVLATGANTLNTTVQDRLRELATLRAVGYGGVALSVSLFQESLLLAAGGGQLGLILARVLVEGSAFRIGMSAISLTVDGRAILVGLCGVILLGLLGTIPAAIRVVRLPVSVALKDGA